MEPENYLQISRALSGKNIRLTLKQWIHITESHDYMAGNKEKVLETVSEPDFIVNGKMNALIALKHYDKTNITEKYCVVVYKETEIDGFVITAFFTSKPETIKSSGIIWKK